MHECSVFVVRNTACKVRRVWCYVKKKEKRKKKKKEKIKKNPILVNPQSY